MAAFLADGVRKEFNAEGVHAPFIVREGVLGKQAHLLLVVEVLAGNENVLFKEVDRVFNLVHLLLRATRSGQNAAVDDRVATEGGHLFENDDAGAGVLRLNSGSKTSKAGTDDDDVIGFVPLDGLVDFVRHERGCSKRGSAGERAGNKAAARNLVGHSCLLSFCNDGSPLDGALLDTVAQDPFWLDAGYGRCRTGAF